MITRVDVGGEGGFEVFNEGISWVAVIILGVEILQVLFVDRKFSGFVVLVAGRGVGSVEADDAKDNVVASSISGPAPSS